MFNAQVRTFPILNSIPNFQMADIELSCYRE